MMSDRWNLKLHALLHDPPHKPLALGRGHEAQGRKLAEVLVGSSAPADMWEAIKKADALASGADRQSWLKELRVDPRTELEIIHPLDGRPILVPGTVSQRPFELAFPPELLDHVESERTIPR